MILEEARVLKLEFVQSLIAGAGLGTRPTDLAAQRVETMSTMHRALALGIAPGGRAGYRVAVRVQRRGVPSETIDQIRRRAAREVDVRYVGRIVKAEAPAGWTRARVRPLRIGLSIGHHAITAGTLGAFVGRAASAYRRLRTSCRTTTSWRTRTGRDRATPSSSPVATTAASSRATGSPR